MKTFQKFIIAFTAIIIFFLYEFSSYVHSSDIQSPSNWIKEDKVFIINDGKANFVQIYFDKEITLVKFRPTKSMDPLFDSETIGIAIVPETFESLRPGDIIVYSGNKNELIAHRILKKGNDGNPYYITKGDNSMTKEKVYFHQVKFVIVALLY